MLFRSYAASFLAIAIVFNVMWRYAVRARLVIEDINVHLITKQYALGPLMYAVLVLVALYSSKAVLVVSAVYALYFALPPALWHRLRRGA